MAHLTHSGLSDVTFTTLISEDRDFSQQIDAWPDPLFFDSSNTWALGEYGCLSTINIDVLIEAATRAALRTALVNLSNYAEVSDTNYDSPIWGTEAGGSAITVTVESITVRAMVEQSGTLAARVSIRMTEGVSA